MQSLLRRYKTLRKGKERLAMSWNTRYVRQYIAGSELFFCVYLLFVWKISGAAFNIFTVQFQSISWFFEMQDFAIVTNFSIHPKEQEGTMAGNCLISKTDLNI